MGRYSSRSRIEEGLRLLQSFQGLLNVVGGKVDPEEAASQRSGGDYGGTGTAKGVQDQVVGVGGDVSVGPRAHPGPGPGTASRRRRRATTKHRTDRP